MDNLYHAHTFIQYIYYFICATFKRFWNICIRSARHDATAELQLAKCQFNFGRFDFELCNIRCTDETINVSTICFSSNNVYENHPSPPSKMLLKDYNQQLMFYCCRIDIRNRAK